MKFRTTSSRKSHLSTHAKSNSKRMELVNNLEGNRFDEATSTNLQLIFGSTNTPSESVRISSKIASRTLY